MRDHALRQGGPHHRAAGEPAGRSTTAAEPPPLVLARALNLRQRRAGQRREQYHFVIFLHRPTGASGGHPGAAAGAPWSRSRCTTSADVHHDPDRYRWLSSGALGGGQSWQRRRADKVRPAAYPDLPATPRMKTPGQIAAINNASVDFPARITISPAFSLPGRSGFMPKPARHNQRIQSARAGAIGQAAEG